MRGEGGVSMKQVDVVIVGAGFSGLYLMHRCLQANRTAVVLEQGSDVGGTWYGIGIRVLDVTRKLGLLFLLFIRARAGVDLV